MGYSPRVAKSQTQLSTNASEANVADHTLKIIVFLKEKQKSSISGGRSIS